jgi:hypothetical protein
MSNIKDYRAEFFTKKELVEMDYAFKVALLGAIKAGREYAPLAVMKANPKAGRATRRVIGIIEPFSGTGSPAAMCTGL